jgi:predicted GH43/DUF377 family glycosyl hydrolase
MWAIKLAKFQAKEDQARYHNLITELPAANTHIPIIEGDIPIALCEYKRLKYLDSKKLINSLDNLYFYNACLLSNNRLFYRVGKEPKGYQDRIATCQITDELDVIEGTNKYIETYSNWKESAQTKYLQSVLPFVFKSGEHVEDPRAIIFENHYFVFYTDGLTIGVAKLDMDCNTIYSHYLYRPKEVGFKNTDLREKNWIPFVNGNSIILLYSADPLVYLIYKDTDTKLEFVRVLLPYNSRVSWKYNYIRGGCPPAEYDSESLLWCFHSAIKTEYSTPKYLIGVYVTENKSPFYPLKICRLPLLMGIPAHASTTLSLQNNVVYPCGLVKFGEGWRISMGVNDYEIAFLDVTEKDFLW